MTTITAEQLRAIYSRFNGLMNSYTHVPQRAANVIDSYNGRTDIQTTSFAADFTYGTAIVPAMTFIGYNGNQQALLNQAHAALLGAISGNAGFASSATMAELSKVLTQNNASIYSLYDTTDKLYPPDKPSGAGAVSLLLKNGEQSFESIVDTHGIDSPTTLSSAADKIDFLTRVFHEFFHANIPHSAFAWNESDGLELSNITPVTEAGLQASNDPYGHSYRLISAMAPYLLDSQGHPLFTQADIDNKFFGGSGTPATKALFYQGVGAINAIKTVNVIDYVQRNFDILTPQQLSDLRSLGYISPISTSGNLDDPSNYKISASAMRTLNAYKEGLKNQTLIFGAADDPFESVQGAFNFLKSSVGGALRFDTSDFLGSIGSVLGNYIAGGNPVAQVAVSATLQTILANLGGYLEDAVNPTSAVPGIEAMQKAALGDQLFSNLESAGVGAISSYLMGELVNAIGLSGFAGKAVSSIAGQTISHIAVNILNNGSAHWADGLSGSFFPVAVGSFLGSQLAFAIGNFDTVEGQLGAQVGSLYGSLNAAAFLAANPELLADPITAIAVVAVIVFVDTILGGEIGSLFGGGTPRSSTAVLFDGTKFANGATWSVHGSNEVANTLATAVSQALNGVLLATGGRLTDGGQVRTGAYGMDGNDFVYWSAGPDNVLNHVAARYKNADDLLRAGVFVALSDMASRMDGGDIYVKRAIAATMAQSGGNISTLNAGQFSMDTLNGNISIAKDYENYLNNALTISAAIDADPDSAFAVGWLVTLSRAAELGLNMRAASDWAGGWAAFMDEAMDNKIDGNAFTPANVSLILDSIDHARRFLFMDGQGNFVGAVEDTIVVSDKTVISATPSSDTITINGDTIANALGTTIDGVAGTFGARKINVAAVIDVGAGDDSVLAGDLGNDVLGGTGNDTLVGGKLDDWLFGDDGNDRLFAGQVSTTSFADINTAALNAALAADGGNGNYLEGGAGDDELYGGTGSDCLSGSAGNDTEFGGDGGDVLAGGASTDSLQGGAGTDQYLFSFGEGADTIFDANAGAVAGTDPQQSLYARISAINLSQIQRDWAGDGNYTANGSVAGGVDAITFGPGISMVNLQMQRSGNDMIIKLGTWDAGYSNYTLTGDQLTVKDWFDDFRSIEWFRFADGEEIRISDIGSIVRGNAGNNYIVGTNSSDFLFGLAGQDTIRAMAGNDFGYGGLGDDFLTGDSGNDLVMGGGGDDCVQGNAGNDVVTGDDGDDNIYGGDGSDTISGGKGNDVVAGGAGDDIFKYSRGDGADTLIDEYSGTWDAVWDSTGGFGAHGYTLQPDGTIWKNGVKYFDQGWINGYYIYDPGSGPTPIATLKRYVDAVDGTLSKTSGNDTIEFATGIDIQDLVVQSINGDLVLGIMADENDTTSFADLTDKIVLKNGKGKNVEALEFSATGTHTISSWTIPSLSDGADSYAGSGSTPSWITGLGGDDTITGGTGNDIIAGDQGSDTLNGGAGDDVLYGGAGNDTLEGSNGKDTLIGGAGEDAASYATSTGAVRVSLGYTLANSYAAWGDTFSGIEDLLGSSSSDTLIGDDNDNVLTGRAGSDQLRGGLGDDTYMWAAGDGGDTINEVGISGAEVVMDTAGNLDANYSTSWTLLSGTAYNYRLVVTDNRTGQVVYQSRDNVDFVYTSPQTLPAGSVWPAVNGQWLLNTMRTGSNPSGSGVQTVRVFDGQAGGNDAILFSTLSLSNITITRSGANVSFGLPSATMTIVNQAVAASAIERLILLDGLTAPLTSLRLVGDASTSGDDFFQGNTSANSFHGGDGNDILSGIAGNDSLYGDNGDDVLEGGVGADSLDGGSDSETLGLPPDTANTTKPYGDTARYAGSTAGVTVDLTITTAQTSGGDASGDRLVNIENLTGSDGFADTLSGDSRGNRLFGLGGNDSIVGRAGEDVLSGGAGNDSLYGDDGDDNVGGGDGNDCLFGGNDKDLLSGDAGDDTLSGDAGNDILSGGDGNDLLNAGDGDDQLGGGAGADQLNGGNGNDALAGGDGNDVINGEVGNDTLSGDGGNDDLHGGVGDDSYVFSSTSGNDTLTDTDGKNGVVISDATHDRIWLAQSGNDLIISMIGSSASILVAGYFINPTTVFSVTTTDQTLFLKYAGGLISAMGAVSLAAPSAMPQSIADLLPTYWDVGTTAAPRVTDQNLIINEDEVKSWHVGAVDHDDNITAYGTASQPMHGSLALNATTGDWIYTPTANYNGQDSFAIKVTDADQHSVTQMVNITLLPMPDPPDSMTLNPIEPALRIAGVDVNAIPERDHVDPAAPTPPALRLGFLSGTDPDLTSAGAFDQLRYSVSDSRFEIRYDGTRQRYELWLKAGAMPSIDFEASPTVTIGVTVTDHWNSVIAGQDLPLSATFNLTLSIVDVPDIFVGGPTGDSLAGTIGMDSIFGNGGNDTLSGVAGADTIIGGSADDLLDGGDGNDYLEGDQGLDRLLGGLGNDTLLAGDDNDSLDGGSDNDSLNGGLGDDTLLGGAGADTIDGGSGTDTVTYATSGAGVNVSLATGTGSGGDAQGDTVTGIEKVIGSTYADTLTGTTATEYFDGGDGADSISGGGGTDTLLGSAGDDTILGADGADSMAGGDGNDHLIGGLGQDSLYGGNGNDWLEAQSDGDVLQGDAGNDTMDGGNGSDSYVVDSNSGADLIRDFDPEGDDKDQLNYGDLSLNRNQLWFQQVGNDLKISVIGGSGTATVENWFDGTPPPANRRIELVVTSTHYAPNVDGLTTLMATKTKPADLAALQALMNDSAYAASWANLWNPNAAPVIQPITNRTTNEDTAIGIVVSASDDTTPTDQLSYDLKAYNDAAHTQLNTSFIQSWSRPTTANGQTLTITPATNVSGTVYLALTATDLTLLASQPSYFALTVTPVADTPVLTTQSAVVGTLDSGSVALNMSADLQDTDGSETLSITVTGLPTGLSLNHGTNMGGGTWSLTKSDLTGLTITGPATWATDFTLGVTAKATESANGSTATTTNHSVPVTINARPTGISGSLSVAENSAQYTNVGTVVGSDPDGDPLTYTMISDANGRFAVSSSGVVTVLGGGPVNLNYEAVTSHTITVRATDPSGLSKDVNLNVGITDVNEKPSTDEHTFSVSEGAGTGTYVGTATSSDPDTNPANRDFRYSIDYQVNPAWGNGPEGGTFSIDPVSGNIYVAHDPHTGPALDYEHNQTYYVHVVTRDQGGYGLYSDGAWQTINIGNVNEAPIMPENSWTIPENYPGGGTAVGNVGASDPEHGALSYSLPYVVDRNWQPETGAFFIDSAGTIRLDHDPHTGSTLDYEHNNTYYVYAVASDGNSSSGAWQTIHISDVNEAPYISSFALANEYDYDGGQRYYYWVGLSDPEGQPASLVTVNGIGAWQNTTGFEFEWDTLWGYQLGLNYVVYDYYGSPSTSYTVDFYGSSVMVTANDPGYPSFSAPVVLDLDNNGVSLVSRKGSAVRFDQDNDGVADRTGWVGPRDGLLALDRNGDGIINNGSEISFKDDIAGAFSDLEGLNAYDSNQNGFLDQGDERFAEFKVWRDANQDGVSSPDELKSLSDYGIESIGLTRTPTGQAVEGGDNVIYATADVRHADGSISTAGDVFLSYDDGTTSDSPAGPSQPDSAASNANPSARKSAMGNPGVPNPASQLPPRRRDGGTVAQDGLAGQSGPASQTDWRRYSDVQENFRSLSQSAYASLSRNALNPQGGTDQWATSLAADHGIGTLSPADVGVGLLEQQMLQMVAAMSTFNAGDSGTVDAAEKARRHYEGTEFLTAVPRLDVSNGPHLT